MSARWRVDDTWTGDWTLPDVLRRPLADEDRAAIVRASCGGVGPARIAAVLAGARSVAEALSGLDLRVDPTARLRRLEQLEVRAVLAPDDEYPEELRAIPAPPPLLYVQGDALSSLAPSVAVVGARVCTRGGRTFARRLGATLAGAGFTVISGLARGIDAAAHAGALDGGRTAAILGTGIERVYPAEHRDLAEDIVRCGTIATEFPPGTTPRPWHFPARNRLVAGLAIAVVVVEAGIGSGALITAGFAADCGREVFACITGPENPAGAGVRELIRDGARLVVDADDLVAELRDLAAAQGYALPHPDSRGVDPAAELSGSERAVFQAITDGTSVDELVAATELPPSAVAAALGGLELDGLVESDGAGRWWRTR